MDNNKTKQSPLTQWINVDDALPTQYKTVWLTNGNNCWLGCLVESDGGWHWAVYTGGDLYIENGEIVAECESEDVDVKYWHEVPKAFFACNSNNSDGSRNFF